MPQVVRHSIQMTTKRCQLTEGGRRVRIPPIQNVVVEEGADLELGSVHEAEEVKSAIKEMLANCRVGCDEQLEGSGYEGSDCRHRHAAFDVACKVWILRQALDELAVIKSPALVTFEIGDPFGDHRVG